MPITELLTESGRILWRNKFLALFGVGYVIGGGILALLLQLWLATNPFTGILLALEEDPEGYLMAGLEGFLNPVWLVAVVVSLFGYILLVWLVSTVCEAGLITSVRRIKAGEKVALGPMLGEGRTYLVRLVAIDTLVYFPLFVVLLTMLLLTSGALIAFILTASSGTIDPASLGIWTLLIGFIDMALLFVALIVGFATGIFRQLSFRSGIIADKKMRPAIRHTWGIIRQHWLMVIIILILLFAIGQVAGFIPAVLLVPVQLISIFRITQNSAAGAPPDALAMLDRSWFESLWTMGVTVVNLGVSAIVVAFGSILWTLCYLYWDKNETNRR